MMGLMSGKMRKWDDGKVRKGGREKREMVALTRAYRSLNITVKLPSLEPLIFCIPTSILMPVFHINILLPYSGWRQRTEKCYSHDFIPAYLTKLHGLYICGRFPIQMSCGTLCILKFISFSVSLFKKLQGGTRV
jgi:hypothetical protein